MYVCLFVCLYARMCAYVLYDMCVSMHACVCVHVQASDRWRLANTSVLADVASAGDISFLKSLDELGGPGLDLWNYVDPFTGNSVWHALVSESNSLAFASCLSFFKYTTAALQQLWFKVRNNEVSCDACTAVMLSLVMLLFSFCLYC
jgi:hypothetical protein